MQVVAVLFSGLPDDRPTTRQEAKLLGATRYFPKRLCIHGHSEGRLASTGKCVACQRERNRPFSLARSRQNAEQNREKSRRWQAENKEKANARKLAWYHRNKEKARATNLAWERANREAVRRHNHNRRSRKAGAEGSYSADDIERIWSAQRKRCALCRSRLSVRTRTIDHIKPLSRGGSNLPSNIQILCFSCNASKWARDPIDHARKLGRLL